MAGGRRRNTTQELQEHSGVREELQKRVMILLATSGISKTLGFTSAFIVAKTQARGIKRAFTSPFWTLIAIV